MYILTFQDCWVSNFLYKLDKFFLTVLFLLQLLSVSPAPNSLALVYKDRETLRFTKHLNHRVTKAKEFEYYTIAATYYENADWKRLWCGIADEGVVSQPSEHCSFGTLLSEHSAWVCVCYVKVLHVKCFVIECKGWNLLNFKLPQSLRMANHEWKGICGQGPRDSYHGIGGIQTRK